MGKRVLLVLIALLLFAGGMIFHAVLPRLIPATTEPAGTSFVPATAPKPQPKPAPAPAAQAPLSTRVTIDSPKKGAVVSHAFTISGKAPGPWYFEASFPIIITDASGSKLTTSHGQAQGEWMTSALVPFSAQVDVGAYKGKITVNLLRDNPSGMPENDDSTAFDLVVQ